MIEINDIHILPVIDVTEFAPPHGNLFPLVLPYIFFCQVRIDNLPYMTSKRRQNKVVQKERVISLTVRKLLNLIMILMD